MLLDTSQERCTPQNAQSNKGFPFELKYRSARQSPALLGRKNRDLGTFFGTCRACATHASFFQPESKLLWFLAREHVQLLVDLIKFGYFRYWFRDWQKWTRAKMDSGTHVASSFLMQVWLLPRE